MTRTTALLIALLIDTLIGKEPPIAIHPVCWMGNWLRFTSNGALKIPAERRYVRLTAGAALIISGIALFALPPLCLARVLRSAPPYIEIIVTALLLKPLFTLSGLIRAGREIQSALAAGDLIEARRLTGYHLVSRDTSELSPDEVAGAVIESLSENLTDSFFSPLFYFCLGGLPAAAAYRLVNTADAMIGYRNEKWEWIGKFAARLDDVLNFVPARICALAIGLAAPMCGADGRGSFAALRHDRKRTASPNAGWTMSVTAGALGVLLKKDGCYVLNAGSGEADADDISRAIRLIESGAWILSACLILLMALLRLW